MDDSIPSETLLALSLFDTCTLANAIESFSVRLRNEGFTGSNIRSFTPKLPPMIGYAETLCVRSSSPPPDQKRYFERTDWWPAPDESFAPKILVIQDVDHHQGLGAFVGGFHAQILKKLGFIGTVTNGAVRDVPDSTVLGFHLFARNLSPSHAFVHVIEHGQPVEVGGLIISPGDLLHGDEHGIVKIPKIIANQLPRVATQLKDRERQIIDYCNSEDFSEEKLRQMLASAS